MSICVSVSVSMCVYVFVCVLDWLSERTKRGERFERRHGRNSGKEKPKGY
jgi:hypothetical protein